MKLLSTFFFIAFFALPAIGQDTAYIKVLFIYGSKPHKAFRQEEKKWFGGIHGGHVGIEYAPERVIDFVPSGTFHWLAHRRHRHSRFNLHSTADFWQYFGSDVTRLKRTVIWVPVTTAQQAQLQALAKTYTTSTPYDYAFIGMRCAAAACDLLGKIGVMETWPRQKIIRKIFYPKKLRKRLLRRVQKEGWKVERWDGTPKRKWERD